MPEACCSFFPEFFYVSRLVPTTTTTLPLRHTARFLFTWLTLLPFALYGSCGVWTTPVVAGIAAVLCGIEEIGVQVEEPFGWVKIDA